MAPDEVDRVAEALAREVGRRVRELRLSRAAPENTLSWVSGRTGLSLSFLSMVENGQRMPSLPALVSLSQCLQAPVGELLGGDPPLDEVLEPIAALFRERKLGSIEAHRLLEVARKLFPQGEGA